VPSFEADARLAGALDWEQKGHPRITAEEGDIEVTQVSAQRALPCGEQRCPAGAVATEAMDDGQMQCSLAVAKIV
jgi:hypothetical protein